jgi:hypothetical protein
VNPLKNTRDTIERVGERVSSGLIAVAAVAICAVVLGLVAIGVALCRS